MPAQTRSADWLISQYAAGTLPPAGHVLARCYLDLNPHKRGVAERLEAMGGWALETAAPVDRAPRLSALELLERYEGEAAAAPVPASDSANDNAGELPAALAQHLGAPLSALKWKWRGPGAYEVRIPSLETGGMTARLLRIEPGRSVPQHTHEGVEATLVLSGAYDDGQGHYGPGDLDIADADVDHKPVASPGTTCLCLAVSEAPLRLTGPLGRLVRALSPGA